jgi:3-oxoacyl-(acyl-carrier-protein) synthase
MEELEFAKARGAKILAEVGQKKLRNSKGATIRS